MTHAITHTKRAGGARRSQAKQKRSRQFDAAEVSDASEDAAGRLISIPKNMERPTCRTRLARELTIAQQIQSVGKKLRSEVVAR
jgi:hypothetical protein